MVMQESEQTKKLVERQRNALGWASRIVCSEVFIGGRFADEVLDNDVLPFSVIRNLLGDQVHVQVDPRCQEVSVTIKGDDGRSLVGKARHTPGYGCAVMPSEDADDQTLTLPLPDPNYNPRSPETDPFPSLPRNQYPTGIHKGLNMAFSPCLGEGKDSTARMDARALVVVHRGRIVGERYAPGFGPSSRFISHSVGKSVAVALLGVYAKTYGLDLDAPAPVEQWQQDPDDARRAIRTIDLLQMASGLDYGRPMAKEHFLGDLDLHSRPYCAALDSEKLASSRPLAHLPGTVFEYKNCDPLLVMAIISQGLARAGENVHTWPRTTLFAPIGATSITMHTDNYGHFIPSGMMTATARDFVRVGQFFLQRGLWNGQQLWPDNWYERITSPSRSEPGYAGFVWTNSTQTLPGVPKDAFFFSGFFGQRIVIVPSADLVVARLGMTLMASTDGRPQDGIGTRSNSVFNDHMGEVVSTILEALA